YGYWTDASALSPDGRTLALGARNGVFGLWETATGKEIVRLTPAGNDYEKAIASVTFSPDSHYVLAGTWGGTFRCWDTLTGEELASRTAHVGGVRAWHSLRMAGRLPPRERTPPSCSGTFPPSSRRVPEEASP